MSVLWYKYICSVFLGIDHILSHSGNYFWLSAVKNNFCCSGFRLLLPFIGLLCGSFYHCRFVLPYFELTNPCFFLNSHSLFQYIDFFSQGLLQACISWKYMPSCFQQEDKHAINIIVHNWDFCPFTLIHYMFVVHWNKR